MAAKCAILILARLFLTFLGAVALRSGQDSRLEGLSETVPEAPALSPADDSALAGTDKLLWIPRAPPDGPRDLRYGLLYDFGWVEKPMGPASVEQRWERRDATKDTVVRKLGLSAFGEKARKTSLKDPFFLKGTWANIFLDKGASAQTAPAGFRNLLGRYDLAVVKVRADMDRQWQPYGPGSPQKDFWVAHAAALNIGETQAAPDFQDFSTDGRLDQDRYSEGMGHIVSNIATACKALQVNELVFFPFGMGAFLRNLAKNDNTYSEEEQHRQLRRQLARSVVEALAKTPPTTTIHLCLPRTVGLKSQEAKQNVDAFLRAFARAEEQLRQRVRVVVQGDSLELAQHLANQAPHQMAPTVMLVNGANRQLLGNHWFQDRAMMAIDENMHRRSWTMAAASYLLNDYAGRDRTDRRPNELAENALKFGGAKIYDLDGSDTTARTQQPNASTQQPNASTQESKPRPWSLRWLLLGVASGLGSVLAFLGCR